MTTYSFVVDAYEVLSMKPELATLLQAMERQVADHGAVSGDVLAQCRARVAHLRGLAPAVVTEVDAPSAHVCVDYAEQFALDAHGVTDAQAAAVVEAIGSDGLVVLTSALALWEAMMRIERTLG